MTACDKAGLLTNVSYTGSTNPASQAFAYDNLNRVQWMTDGWVSNDFNYDALGRLVQINEDGQGSTQILTYAYNEIGLVTTTTWQISGNTNVFTTAYDYDPLGRVTNVTSESGSFAYSYTNAGLQIEQLIYPNSETANFTYDNLGRRRPCTNL